MNEKGEKPPEKLEQHKYQPGEGIRSMRSTGVFRAVNFELYAKPVSDKSDYEMSQREHCW